MSNSRNSLIESLHDLIGDKTSSELDKTNCQELLKKLTDEPKPQSASDPPPIIGN